eukprot:4696999-Pleurochrysis_carterae.AAC.2
MRRPVQRSLTRGPRLVAVTLVHAPRAWRLVHPATPRGVDCAWRLVRRRRERQRGGGGAVSYTHLRAHETDSYL